MLSGQSWGRKITLVVETVYNVINMVFAWFSMVSDYSIKDWVFVLIVTVG